MDEETLELLERRLAERVESRVRSRLFLYYFATGSVILAALGYFGYDIVSDIRQIPSDVRERTQQVAEEAVAPTVAKVQQAVADANAQTGEAKAMLDVLTDWMAQRTQKLSEIEDNVQKTIAGIRKVATDLDAKLVAVSAEIQANEETLADQRKRAQDLYAGKGDLSQLADELIKLSGQVKELDNRMVSIATAQPGPAADRDEEHFASQQAIQDVIDTSSQIVVGSETGDATVYLQFAGVDRDVADALGAALEEQDFIMPGAERTGVAAGMHEVRYFFADDVFAAQRLADATNAWLASKGFAADVSVRDAIGFGGAKPRPGVLELWIEPKQG